MFLTDIDQNNWQKNPQKYCDGHHIMNEALVTVQRDLRQN